MRHPFEGIQAGISLPFVSLPASDVKGDTGYGMKLMLALSKCSI